VAKKYNSLTQMLDGKEIGPEACYRVICLSVHIYVPARIQPFSDQLAIDS